MWTSKLLKILNYECSACLYICTAKTFQSVDVFLEYNLLSICATNHYITNPLSIRVAAQLLQNRCSQSSNTMKTLSKYKQQEPQSLQMEFIFRKNVERIQLKWTEIRKLNFDFMK